MNENPSVNRALKDRQFDHIDHALGRPTWPLLESYRNYFATDADSEHGRAFRASPHWERGGTAPGGLTFFRVTEAGRLALAEHIESLGTYRVFTVRFEGHNRQVVATTASKARYEYFSQISDCLPDVTFGDFLRTSRVQRAA